MDPTSLRTLALGIQFECQIGGVDATVTRPVPYEDEIATRGIWVTPLTQDVPGGFEIQRKEQRRVIALRTSEVATVPRGTTILAPENGTTLGWRVDGIEKVEAEHVRVVVVRDPELDAVLDLDV